MRALSSIVAAVASTLAVTAVATAVGVVGAAPAHATVADVTSGGPISRSTIVERALSWADERVSYSQSSYWPAGAPATGIGHGYRQDCSGFLSMAWDLPSSAVTGDFVSTTSPYDTQLSSWAALQPGDMLGITGHVVLFVGWSADDEGQHRYFDMVSESVPGQPTALATDQDADGYWVHYLPYRYDNVLADAPATTSWGPGRTDQVTLNAADHVIQRFQTTVGGSWATADLTAILGFPTMRTAPTIASAGPARLDIIGIGANGSLVDYDYDAGWRPEVLAASGTVVGLAAAGGDGRVDVVGRLLGGDAAGTLVHGDLVGTSWSGWSAVAGAPPLSADPALGAAGSQLDVAVEGVSGALVLGTSTGASWAWSAPLWATAMPSRPSVSVLVDGTVVVTADVAGALEEATGTGGFWTDLTPIAGTPAIAGPPAASYTPGGAPLTAAQRRPGWAWTHQQLLRSGISPLDVFAQTSTGTVVHVQRSLSGVWTYLGTN